MFDANLCNESWFEMEIANIQTEMSNYPYLSQEYIELSSKMDDYACTVVRIEGVKREREMIIEKYIETGAKIAGIFIAGIFGVVVARRFIK